LATSLREHVGGFEAGEGVGGDQQPEVVIEEVEDLHLAWLQAVLPDNDYAVGDTSADPAGPGAWTALAAQRALLMGILLDIALMGWRVALYPPFLAQRDSLTYLVPPVAALLMYGGLVIAVTTGATAGRRPNALRTGSLFGIVTGAMWVVNLAVETFADFSGAASVITSAPPLLGGFALWGVAGGIGARQTGTLSLGVLAAVWAAMTCVLITVTFGFALAFTSMPRLEQLLVSDPDYLRSGWHDLRAFAIANQFNAAASHLIAAPIIAAIVGLIGGLLTTGALRLHSRAERSRAGRE
jgi:hypothetical protein